MKAQINLSIIFLMFLLTGCKNETSLKGEEKIEGNQFNLTVLKNWNEAHNNKDFEGFENLYVNEVVFYGQNIGIPKILKSKKSLLDKNPSFKQEINQNTIEITELDHGYRVSFEKLVTINNKVTTYPSYLELKGSEDNLKISVEGDQITDENLAKRKNKTNDAIESAKKELEKVYGDFNGNGSQEYAWIEMPELVYHEDIEVNGEERLDFGYYECIGGCNAIIRFSDIKLNPITIYNVARSARLEKTGDWNSDGKDDLGVTEMGRSFNHTLYNVITGLPLAPSSWVNVNIHDELYFESVFSKAGKDKIKIKSSLYTDSWSITDTIVSVKDFNGADYLESQKGEAITRYYNY